MQINYAIYATLLDAFNWYLRSESPDAKQELLDKINRAPKERTPQQMRGVLFNDLIDGKPVSDADIKIHKLNYPEIIWEINNELVGTLRQVYLETTGFMPRVKLYGFADAIYANTIYDIKTTKDYYVGKYYKSMQHRVYLECMRDKHVDTFIYLITDFKGVYKEFYTIGADSGELRSTVAHFIEFLEENKYLITDKKIFGG